MKKVVITAYLFGSITFIFLYFFLPDFTTYFQAFIAGLTCVGVRYLIDRFGFDEIDTIQILQDNPHYYIRYITEYSILFAVGFLTTIIVYGFG
ncbi:MAG: hypothetical protein KatS3mg083_109 [Candidatus Dojkabacteria bacterium]|nr:MAG: hypothetical protein KatS3mg083_109 [Candidatus Dojkabacteria bacterium]